VRAVLQHRQPAVVRVRSSMVSGFVRTPVGPVALRVDSPGQAVTIFWCMQQQEKQQGKQQEMQQEKQQEKQQEGTQYLSQKCQALPGACNDTSATVSS